MHTVEFVRLLDIDGNKPGSKTTAIEYKTYSHYIIWRYIYKKFDKKYN
jgi:hypothetical protein